MKPSKPINYKMIGGGQAYNQNVNQNNLPEFSGFLEPLFRLSSGVLQKGAKYAIEATAHFLNVDISGKNQNEILDSFNQALTNPETRRKFIEFATNFADNASIILQITKPIFEEAVRNMLSIFEEIAKKAGSTVVKVGKHVTSEVPILGTIISMVYLFDDITKFIQSSISAGMKLSTTANASVIKAKEQWDTLKQLKQDSNKSQERIDNNLNMMINQRQGQNPYRVQSQGQGQSQTQSQSQGQIPYQGEAQGQTEPPYQSQNQGEAQGQNQNQGEAQGQNQNQGEAQGQNQNQDEAQGQNQGQNIIPNNISGFVKKKVNQLQKSETFNKYKDLTQNNLNQLQKSNSFNQIKDLAQNNLTKLQKSNSFNKFKDLAQNKLNQIKKSESLNKLNNYFGKKVNEAKNIKNIADLKNFTGNTVKGILNKTNKTINNQLSKVNKQTAGKKYKYKHKITKRRSI
jgi:hypothetical protein